MMKIHALVLCTLLPVSLLACDRDRPQPRPPAEDVDATTGDYGNNPHMRMPHPTTAQPQAQPPDVPAATAPPADPTVASFAGLEAPKPATWIWHPPANPFIHTNYTVPGADGGKSVALNIYAGIGGTVRQNIERWKQQFRSPDGYEVEPVIEEFEVDGMNVAFVELAGEWMQMGAQWYTRDQLFLAAIIDAPAGQVFIRFAGDDKTVEANRERFMEMVRGIRRVDEEPAQGEPDQPGGYGY